MMSQSINRSQFGSGAAPHAIWTHLWQFRGQLLDFVDCHQCSAETLQTRRGYSLILNTGGIKLLVPTPTSSLSTTSSSSLETGVGGWITCSKVGCPFEVRSTTQFFLNLDIFFPFLINGLRSSLVMHSWNLSEWFKNLT